MRELFPQASVQENPRVNEWVKELVFHRAVFGKYATNDAEQRIRQYKAMLKEAAGDYLRDYKLLNAFKHGCRTRVSGESASSISLNVSGQSSPSFIVGQYNVSITYYSLNDLKVNGIT